MALRTRKLGPLKYMEEVKETKLAIEVDFCFSQDKRKNIYYTQLFDTMISREKWIIMKVSETEYHRIQSAETPTTCIKEIMSESGREVYCAEFVNGETFGTLEELDSDLIKSILLRIN